MHNEKSLVEMLAGRTFCSRVNKEDRPVFIRLAELWIAKNCKHGEQFCSDNLQGIARQHGYSRQAPRNAMLALEARGSIIRNGKQRISDAKRPAILYKPVK